MRRWGEGRTAQWLAAAEHAEDLAESEPDPSASASMLKLGARCMHFVGAQPTQQGGGGTQLQSSPQSAGGGRQESERRRFAALSPAQCDFAARVLRASAKLSVVHRPLLAYVAASVRTQAATVSAVTLTSSVWAAAQARHAVEGKQLCGAVAAALASRPWRLQYASDLNQHRIAAVVYAFSRLRYVNQRSLENLSREYAAVFDTVGSAAPGRAKDIDPEALCNVAHRMARLSRLPPLFAEQISWQVVHNEAFYQALARSPSAAVQLPHALASAVAGPFAGFPQLQPFAPSVGGVASSPQHRHSAFSAAGNDAQILQQHPLPSSSAIGSASLPQHEPIGRASSPQRQQQPLTPSPATGSAGLPPQQPTGSARLPQQQQQPSTPSSATGSANLPQQRPFAPSSLMGSVTFPQRQPLTPSYAMGSAGFMEQQHPAPPSTGDDPRAPRRRQNALVMQALEKLSKLTVLFAADAAKRASLGERAASASQARTAEEPCRALRWQTAALARCVAGYACAGLTLPSLLLASRPLWDAAALARLPTDLTAGLLGAYAAASSQAHALFDTVCFLAAAAAPSLPDTELTDLPHRLYLSRRFSSISPRAWCLMYAGLCSSSTGVARLAFRTFLSASRRVVGLAWPAARARRLRLEPGLLLRACSAAAGVDCRAGGRPAESPWLPLRLDPLGHRSDAGDAACVEVLRLAAAYAVSGAATPHGRRALAGAAVGVVQHWAGQHHPSSAAQVGAVASLLNRCETSEAFSRDRAAEAPPDDEDAAAETELRVCGTEFVFRAFGPEAPPIPPSCLIPWLVAAGEVAALLQSRAAAGGGGDAPRAACNPRDSEDSVLQEVACSVLQDETEHHRADPAAATAEQFGQKVASLAAAATERWLSCQLTCADARDTLGFAARTVPWGVDLVLLETACARLLASFALECGQASGPAEAGRLRAVAAESAGFLQFLQPLVAGGPGVVLLRHSVRCAAAVRTAIELLSRYASGTGRW
ncbi:hypothetical protein DIPPA_24677 [Diplonema papillatum]|nr:hypothetical protein DIPPA_24677 [Diplonema papillatum]